MLVKFYIDSEIADFNAVDTFLDRHFEGMATVYQTYPDFVVVDMDRDISLEYFINTMRLYYNHIEYKGLLELFN